MRWLAAIVGAALVVGACTGGGSRRVTPPTPTPTVLPSADRIRLSQTRLGGLASCRDDEYCAAGLTRVYGIDLGDRIVSLTDPSAVVGALGAGAIDVAVLPRFAVDLGSFPVTRLTDDRHLLPAGNVIPIVSPALAQAAGPTIDAVTARLDQRSFDTLEASVQSGEEPQAVATTWLQQHGFPRSHPAPQPGLPSVVIATPSDPETAALSYLYAGALTTANVTVLPIDGGRAEVLQSLENGAANFAVDDVAPLLEFLSGYTGVATADVNHTVALLRAGLGAVGLVTTAPAPASPGVVFAVSQDVAKTLSLTSLSDLARASGVHTPPAVAPVAASTAWPGPSALGIGATGAGVLALQERLIALGYDRLLLATGTFDDATRRAVVAFQTDQGLVDTGVADATTQQALAAAKPSGRSTSPPDPGDADSVRPTGSAIYLLFAGGPSPTTPQVLTQLNRRGASATFFAEEGALSRHGDFMRTVVAADGIGIAETPHDGGSPVGADVMLRTATRTRDDLAAAAGKTPTCVLAPYGATDPASRARLASAGFRPVLWDIDPQDWRRPGTAVIATDVIDNVKPGSIVLLHDGEGDPSQMLAALPTILDTLTARGYTFAALPDCS